MRLDWLPGWWGIAVCVAWGVAIGIVGTLVVQDWRLWAHTDRGRHRGESSEEGSGEGR